MDGEMAWVAQEKNKGTFMAAASTLDSHGGWGFNPQHYDRITEMTPQGPVTTYERKTPAEAKLLTDEELRKNSFFKRFADDRLYDASKGSAAAERLYNQANALALQELAATTNNTRQVEILEQLNRRRVYDLGKNQDAIEQYNTLKHHIHNTLWSPSNTYFDYLRWIGLALCRTMPDQAAAHYQFIIDDAATPPGPRAMLSLDLAEHLIHHHKQPALALALIENTLAEHPTGPHTPRAHYWLMLSAYIKNNKSIAEKHAKEIIANTDKSNFNTELFYKMSTRIILRDSLREDSERSAYAKAKTLLKMNLKLISDI